MTDKKAIGCKNVWCACVSVLIAAFTLPKLYEWKKEEIDFYFEKAVKQTKQAYNTHLAPIVNKIPRASTTTSDSNGKKVQ